MHFFLCLLLGLFYTTAFAGIHDQLKKLEETSGGKIGVYALNTTNQKQVGYRENEPFLLGSTFKTLVVAAALKQSMSTPSFMQTNILITPEDISSWAPVTSKHVQQYLSLQDLSAAAITHSDNTAAKLIMDKLGGTQTIVAFARSIHDNHFTLNPPPADLKPTSTPYNMTNNLQQLILGDVLAPAQRDELLAWMKANTTGNQRIRAGVPKGWVVADKTGSGDHGITNDIAVIYPPQAGPIILSIFYAHPDQNARNRPDILAQVTREVLTIIMLGAY